MHRHSWSCLCKGVPYIIIGDQVFPGYANTYDDGLKQAIKSLYETKKEDRYDVFEAYNEDIAKKAKAEKSATATPIIWNFIFISIATIIICCYTNSSNQKLLAAIKGVKKDTKKLMEDEEEDEAPRKTTTRKRK